MSKERKTCNTCAFATQIDRAKSLGWPIKGEGGVRYCARSHRSLIYDQHDCPIYVYYKECDYDANTASEPY